MFILKSAFCRSYQAAFRLVMPVLPYREPKVIDSCFALGHVFEEEGTRAVLVAAERGIVENGRLARLKGALKQCGITYVVCDKTRPARILWTF